MARASWSTATGPLARSGWRPAPRLGTSTSTWRPASGRRRRRAMSFGPASSGKSNRSSGGLLSSREAEVPTTSVTARGLRHVFGDGTVALDGVDLEIAAGSFVAIVGPSGCGKSTLLRLIAGLETPTAGTLAVGARESSGTGPRVAFVFQDAHLLLWRTVV